MYSGGSVVGKAATVGIEISPTPPPAGVVVNITRESVNFEPLAFENITRYPNSETNILCSHDRHMCSPSLLKLSPRTPENLLSVLSHLLKFKGIIIALASFDSVLYCLVCK